jgi:hypothetical protein
VVFGLVGLFLPLGFLGLLEFLGLFGLLSLFEPLSFFGLLSYLGH